MNKRWRLGFLASHRGSNMQAIIEACRDGRIAADPAVVISNNRDAPALACAAEAGVPALHLGAGAFPDAESLDRAITAALKQHAVDLVILAGYMKRLGPQTLAAFPARVVNIHPGLLPRYGGQGMFGSRVHAAVIAAGEKETGITVHLVDADYDHGLTLAVRRVPVMPGESAESLAERMLPLEHELYVTTIADVVSGRLPVPPRPFRKM
ncbi:MAG: phosphoribosylglycinamide formyltransferase [Gammaproteobacteria bacterium]|nr:phosphoribosylglycinamide formyltransferase [Gammaproteobacteria bacterium]